MILNKDILKALENEIGYADLSDLLKVFIEDLKENYSKLQVDTISNEELSSITHTLKSTAGTFGAEELSILAFEINTDIKANNLKDSSVTKLTEMISETIEFFQDISDSQS